MEVKVKVEDATNEVTESSSSTPDEVLSSPLTVRVQLPLRHALLENQVHVLEVILQYGDQERTVLMIDLRDEIKTESPKKEEQPEVPAVEEMDTRDQSLPPPPLTSSSPQERSRPSSPTTSHRATSQGPESAIDIQQKANADTPGDLSPLPEKEVAVKKNFTCNKRFSRRTTLRRHAFAHRSPRENETTMQEWANKCYFCSKRFQTLSKLERHLIVHTREKSYSCDNCKKRFSKRSGLASHKCLEELPWKCTRCQKSYATKSGLNFHIKAIHFRIKKFPCSECDQKFGHKRHVAIHRNKVHIRIRYSCRHPTCINSKSFSRLSTLRNHVRQVHPKQLRC